MGKLRHGAVLAPACSGVWAGWVLRGVGASSGVGIPVGAQHPTHCWVVPRVLLSPGTLRAPPHQGAGAGVPGVGGPRGAALGERLVLIKTFPLILPWLAASPALPA